MISAPAEPDASAGDAEGLYITFARPAIARPDTDMKNKLRQLLKKSTLIKKLKWDFEYAIGRWKFLGSDQEDGRSRNIIEMMKAGCAPRPAILEMGCGEGFFATKLGEFPFMSYLGVDFSDVAIRKANARRLPHAMFEVGDMNTWTAKSRYDVIIFNESIYYSDDAVAQLAKYSQWLNPGGRIIISVYIMTGTQELVDRILLAYKPVAEKEAYIKEMGYWRQFMFAI